MGRSVAVAETAVIESLSVFINGQGFLLAFVN
jgi:hypothetical protein